MLVWGAGEDGQLGLGPEQTYLSTPAFCDAIRGERICQVACGAAITAALSGKHSTRTCQEESQAYVLCAAVDGRVWAWGRLIKQIWEPTLVMDTEDKVNQIACGTSCMAAWQGKG